MSKIIRSENVGQVSQWRMPEVESLSSSMQRVNDYHEGIAALGGEIPTARELEAIQKRAYDESYKEGYQDGINIAKDEQTNIMVILNGILDQLNDLKTSLNDQVKNELSELAIVIAKQILRREILLKPEYIYSVVEESVNLLPVFSRDISICLHSEDAAVISKLIESSGAQSAWKLVEDESVARGGCKVMTEHSVLDNTIEMQISKIAARFLDHTDENQEINI